MLSLEMILQARSRLHGLLPRTPLISCETLSRRLGCRVSLKLECLQKTGSFKPRGALWALATNLQRHPYKEVTACSTGNHGAAVAFAAKTLGVRATIFLPDNPNPVKKKKIEDLGARAVESGSQDLAAAFEAAKDYSRRDGVYFLNDATDPDLAAGPATSKDQSAATLPRRFSDPELCGKCVEVKPNQTNVLDLHLE